MNQILNIETNYSLLSSLISIDSLISYAKEKRHHGVRESTIQTSSLAWSFIRHVKKKTSSRSSVYR